MFETSISHNNVPVIRIDGKIIGGAANALKREMDKQIEQSRGGLVLDMANVPLLDSTALGIIIATLQFLKKMDGKLVLLNPQHAVINVLQVTRLNTILEVYSDEESGNECPRLIAEIYHETFYGLRMGLRWQLVLLFLLVSLIPLADRHLLDTPGYGTRGTDKIQSRRTLVSNRLNIA